MPNVKAIWFPLSLTLVCLFAGIILLIEGYLWGTPLVLASVVLGLDTRARYTEYLRFKGQAFDKHQANYMRRSYCKRLAYTEAMKQSSLSHRGRLAESFYESRGYRWYHFFPDKTFTRNSPFLRKRFWKEVVGL